MSCVPHGVLVLIVGLTVAGSPEASPLSPAALARAARGARLADIDPGGDHGDRTIGPWLSALVRGRARSIAWSGGRCRLVRPEIARDSGGSGARCGHATIRLKQPGRPDDVPVVEVYFDRPRAGAVPRAYAFRGIVLLAGGLEYTRFTRDFEAAWRDRFPPSQR